MAHFISQFRPTYLARTENHKQTERTDKMIRIFPILYKTIVHNTIRSIACGPQRKIVCLFHVAGALAFSTAVLSDGSSHEVQSGRLECSSSANENERPEKHLGNCQS